MHRVFCRPYLRVASSHSNSFVTLMPPPSLASCVLRSVAALLSLRPCTVVVVRHISSSSGRQARECCPRLSSSSSPSSLSSVNCEPPSVSCFEILRVRFLPMVSMVLRLIERVLLPLEESSDGTKLNQDCIMWSISGRRVGRQPDMMPIDGSTEDQMKTSLLAQLMSFDLTSRVMVIMRYMEAKHTLALSASVAGVNIPQLRGFVSTLMVAPMWRVEGPRTNFRAGRSMRWRFSGASQAAIV